MRGRNKDDDCALAFGKEVVRQFHAASLISESLVSCSGCNRTGPMKATSSSEQSGVLRLPIRFDCCA